jgi:hypothetical protein
VAWTQRCFAPEEFRHSTPERVAFGTVPVPSGTMQKTVQLQVQRDFCVSICNHAANTGSR